MNYKVIVDAGHGGDDPGAVSGNLKEKDFTLEAANYMYNRFRELGVPVAITRDVDKTLTREERLNTMTNTFGNGPEVIKSHKCGRWRRCRNSLPPKKH